MWYEIQLPICLAEEIVNYAVGQIQQIHAGMILRKYAAEIRPFSFQAFHIFGAFSAPMLFRVDRLLLQSVFARHSSLIRRISGTFPTVMEGDRDLAVIKGGYYEDLK